MKTKKPNVVMFVVDSARYYSTGGMDDRDKLSMMDDFEKESVYFPVTVTTAPSSVMSLSSMITSLPAYYIARNYDDFRYDDEQFVSLAHILKEQGYNVHCALNAKELRFLFSENLNHVGRKHWPKGTESTQMNWSNATMNKILESFLEKENTDDPFFMLVWYNIRHDPNTSTLIEEGIDLLKKHNVYDDSVFILTADHGYMDPRRGYTPEKLLEMGLSHDLLLTDDNIRIPFYLRYPGFTPKKVESPVSTLDFMPTILSLLDIEYDKGQKLHGMNLVDLIDGKEGEAEIFDKRKIRCDARFFAQKDRSTALRDVEYKYIVRPDTNVEELYYLPDDDWEDNNIINDEKHADVLKEFRQEYEESESEIIEFQYNYLLKKLSRSFKLNGSAEKSKFLIFGLGEPYYIDNLTMVFRSYFGDKSTVDMVLPTEIKTKLKNLDQFNSVYDYDLSNMEEFKVDKKKYNYLIIFSDKRNFKAHQAHQETVLPLLSFDKKVFIDPNMDFSSSNMPSYKTIWLMMKRKRKFYFKNPKLFFSDFAGWFKKFFS